jgi:hypothetical protein
MFKFFLRKIEIRKCTECVQQAFSFLNLVMNIIQEKIGDLRLPCSIASCAFRCVRNLLK